MCRFLATHRPVFRDFPADTMQPVIFNCTMTVTGRVGVSHSNDKCCLARCFRTDGGAPFVMGGRISPIIGAAGGVDPPIRPIFSSGWHYCPRQADRLGGLPRTLRWRFFIGSRGFPDQSGDMRALWRVCTWGSRVDEIPGSVRGRYRGDGLRHYGAERGGWCRRNWRGLSAGRIGSPTRSIRWHATGRFISASR